MAVASSQRDGDPEGPGASPASTEAARGLGRHFWVLTGATSLSAVGDQFFNVALPWAVLKSTGSAFAATLSLGVAAVPYVSAPLLGWVIDRFNRARLFFVSEIVRGLSVALVPVLLALGATTALLALLLVSGCAAVISSLTSDFALIPSTVDASKMATAYSRYAAAVNVAKLVGPALAGVTIVVLSPSVAIWINAVSFLATAGAALTLPARSAPSPSPVRVREGLRLGLRAFKDNRPVVRLTVSLTLFNLGTGGLTAAIVVLSGTVWHWSSSGAGFVLSAGAVLGILGALVGDRFFAGRSVEGRITCWLAACALAAALMAATSIGLVAACGFALLIMFETASNVVILAWRRTVIDEAVTGRVNAIIRMFSFGAIPISAILLGAAIERFHAAALLLVLGFCIASWLAWMVRPSDLDVIA